MLVFLFALVVLSTAQQGFAPINENFLNCGLTCSRNVQYTVLIDNARTTVKCTDNNADPRERCAGCCAARALAARLDASSAAAFPGNNGKDCVCCILNNQCMGK